MICRGGLEAINMMRKLRPRYRLDYVGHSGTPTSHSVMYKAATKDP